VHEGDVLPVKGEIMHEPKVSALSVRERYYIALMHGCLYSVEWNSEMDYWNGGMLYRTYLIIQHVLYSEQ